MTKVSSARSWDLTHPERAKEQRISKETGEQNMKQKTQETEQEPRCDSCHRGLQSPSGGVVMGLSIVVDLSNMHPDDAEFFKKYLGKYYKYLDEHGVAKFRFCHECFLDVMFSKSRVGGGGGLL